MISPYNLNLRHIRGVSAIAARGRIVMAASDVGLSQPALTQGLARLERLLGAQLFERRPDGMVATAAGLVMIACSVELFEHLAQALRQPIRTGRGFAEPEVLVTMTQLRAMIALADTGSFVMASARSGLAPSALCRAVRDIEQLVGASLTERRGRGIEITEAGLRAKAGFRRAVATLHSALEEIWRITPERAAGHGGDRQSTPSGRRQLPPTNGVIARFDRPTHLRASEEFHLSPKRFRRPGEFAARHAVQLVSG